MYRDYLLVLESAMFVKIAGGLLGELPASALSRQGNQKPLHLKTPKLTQAVPHSEPLPV